MQQPEAGPPERSRIRRRLAVGAALLAPLLLAGCQLPSFGALRGATTQGQATFKLWQGFFIAGLIVGGIVMVLILWALVRYRRRPSTTGLPKQFQYQLPLEIVYTIIPIVIVLVLFVFTVITENQVDAVSSSPGTTVNVLAFQWGWRFTYPGHGVSVVGVTTEDPEMVVPYGETVRVNLRSQDVIHGFYVPQFNFSRYAQPGVLNTFDLDIKRPGTYRGQCTQLCGLYHALMFFRVKAVSPNAYQAWLAREQNTQLTSSSSSTGSTSTTGKGA